MNRLYALGGILGLALERNRDALLTYLWTDEEFVNVWDENHYNLLLDEIAKRDKVDLLSYIFNSNLTKNIFL